MAQRPHRSLTRRITLWALLLLGLGLVGWWGKARLDAVLEPEARVDWTPQLQRAAADARLLRPADSTPDGPLLARHGLWLEFDPAHHLAQWVLYELRSADLELPPPSHGSGRPAFRADPALPGQSARPEDYRGSGYDRGHLAPDADLSHHPGLLQASYYLSNACPQVPEFNRGCWRQLEEHIRDAARRFGRVWVCAGPVLQTGLPRLPGATGVSIPKAYFKAVAVLGPGTCSMAGWLLPNAPCETPLNEALLSIDDLERHTGLDFWPGLPDSAEAVLEARLTRRHWQPRRRYRW